MATSNSIVRVGGSGFTVMTWGGATLAYLQTIQDTAPTPVAQAVPVQSISDPFPTEIVTARAVGAGTLRLTFYETWDHAVWEDLLMTGHPGKSPLVPGLTRESSSLLDVFKQQVLSAAIVITKVIQSPNNKNKPRVKVYHNCRITDVDDGEQINISTMIMPKGITVMYTHYTQT